MEKILKAIWGFLTEEIEGSRIVQEGKVKTKRPPIPPSISNKIVIFDGEFCKCCNMPMFKKKSI